ncbi:MAG: hypothetical protein HDR17_07525 [Lachnospiraceae bacterium]|nr:hypothetical protein [Lachnospiraceae bacterium]
MNGIEISILGTKYVFYGISEELAENIRQLAGRKEFQADLRSWGLWLQSMMRKAVVVETTSKADSIVVCDPYGMIGQDESDISLQKLADAEIPEEEKAKITEEKANIAVSAFVEALGGNVKGETLNWQNAIKEMFTSFVCSAKGRVLGAQCTNQSSRSYSTVGPFPTVLFIDFSSVMENTPKLLLPIIMHETTHFLEEKAIVTITNKYAFDIARKEHVEIPDEIWDPEKSSTMGQNADWIKIFSKEKEYQQKYPEERLPTLIEKMAAGSLYEKENRAWVDRLKELFGEVLHANNICVDQSC